MKRLIFLNIFCMAIPLLKTQENLPQEQLPSSPPIHQNQIKLLQEQAFEATREYLKNNPTPNQIQNAITYFEYYYYSPLNPAQSFEPSLESPLDSDNKTKTFVHQIVLIAQSIINQEYGIASRAGKNELQKSPVSGIIYKKVIEILKNSFNSATQKS